MHLSEVADIGDDIVVDHMQRCKDAGADPHSKPMLWKTIETVEDYMPADAMPVELRAVTTYVSAALGHERKRRLRMLVRKDDPRVSLDQMRTYTIEDVEREQAA